MSFYTDYKSLKKYMDENDYWAIKFVYKHLSEAKKNYVAKYLVAVELSENIPDKKEFLKRLYDDIPDPL